ncbi:MAG: hypothetical protein OXG78_16520 [Chloroflexi bacterium]|nr:hypothetical protein [Chloroflexota bacterium]
MKSERKSKATRKMNRSSRGCLVSIGVMLGCAFSLFLASLRYGSSLVQNHELRIVMETYYFGNGLADLTGNTSVLKNVVTESKLEYQIEHCKKGLCDGGYPPHVIGEYFNVVHQTDEFAVIELEDRPIMVTPGETNRGYLKWCYLLVHDGDDWRVDDMYYNCDGYLRQLNK